MDIKELTEKYRAFNIKKRVLFLIFISTFFTAYDYFIESEKLDEEISYAYNELEKTKKNLEVSIEQQKKLPEMESKLLDIEELLLDAGKKLPDEFFIDRVLKSISEIAISKGVDIKIFDPKSPKRSTTAFTYIFLPISLELFGNFPKIIEFLEEILNLELLIDIQNLDFSLTEIKKEESINQEKLTDTEKYNKARERSRMLVTLELIVYRSLGQDEINAIKEKNQGS